MLTSQKRLALIFSSIILILLVPLIAMQFSSEVSWSGLDFFIAAILLLFTGLGIEIVIRKASTFGFRLLLVLAIVLVFLLLWAEMAVGILGTPLAGS